NSFREATYAKNNNGDVKSRIKRKSNSDHHISVFWRFLLIMPSQMTEDDVIVTRGRSDNNVTTKELPSEHIPDVDVHETHCRVFNIIPSISAITGISPQRYFWRISVAIHIGPRFGLIACYRSHYNSILEKIQDEIIKKKARLLSTLVFWFHTVELSALCGVTYVSNRENYRNIL
ncbi:Post-GPI attachment to proteins factor 2-like, partial [Pseudolycoriella hygida]